MWDRETDPPILTLEITPTLLAGRMNQLKSSTPNNYNRGEEGTPTLNPWRDLNFLKLNDL
jgi:hypothetical protein